MSGPWSLQKRREVVKRGTGRMAGKRSSSSIIIRDKRGVFFGKRFFMLFTLGI